MTLLNMRLRGAFNGAAKTPLRSVSGALLLALVYLAMHSLTIRALRFLDGMPDIGTIADAVVQRSLEGLMVVLMVAVAFSVLTGAIGTLYASTDLPFLLSQPVAAWRVFGLKVAETYASSALLPAAFTVPVIVALGVHRGAPLSFYPLALLVLASLYALPVALGALLSLVLMRLAPEGRARGVATAASVTVAAGMVLGLRALRPEQLTALSPDEFETMLSAFATFDVGWLPSSWASDAIWQALAGRASAGLAVLLAAAGLSLAVVALTAAWAYGAGWFRSLDTRSDSARRRRVGGRMPAWQRLLARVGRGLVLKDTLVLMRDPSQWSQLLVLAALAGVYFMSTASLSVGVQQFRDAIGAMNVAFLAFLLSGVGIRLSFPLVSLEGDAFWLLRCAPIAAGRVVLAKFLGSLPLMLVLGTGLGFAVAGRLELWPAPAPARARA
ncbi:MAG TPA: hypothetical protein VFD39_00590, partial [Trueperaceae bacterium]|nr:hypothetical protein [Trueperaceae bacterium]